MGMTISEKILADHAGLDKVKPGQLIEAKLDMTLANDITAPIGIKEFEKIGVNKVWNTERISLVPDHFTPNKDIKSAEQVKMVREFAKKMNISNYFEVGEMGIEHALLPEQGLVLPGDLIIGADSHTCTYGALGAFSTGVGSTDFACAMATGKAWFKVPESIKFILKGKLKKWVSGKDIILKIIGDIGVDGARYMSMEFSGDGIRELSMDKDIEPQVALPHLPENTKPVSEVKNINIDQVVIGSCTNGRLEDLRIAASILKGKKVKKGIRCLVFPATQKIYLDALKEGIIETFIEAGAAVSTPTCGPCLGGHMGILAKGERAISTTNRNFVGRMGHKESEVYLASPAVAAASAILGKIASPEEIE